MEYEVFFHPTARKDLDLLPSRIEDEFWNIIERYLKRIPFAEGIGLLGKRTEEQEFAEECLVTAFPLR